MTNEKYEQLVSHLENIHELESIQEVLSWDEMVNMPPGGAGIRSNQLSFLSELIHNRKTNDKIGSLLDRLEDPSTYDSLSEDQQVVIRETRRIYRKETALPESFVVKKSRAMSDGYEAWLEARENDDFETFAPELERHLELARKEAEYLGYDRSPYDALIDRFVPEFTEQQVQHLFQDLKEQLLPIVDTITESDIDSPRNNKIRGKHWDPEIQKEVGRKFVESFGYDLDGGRIDQSPHPFCSGVKGDVRITTRYRQEDPLEAWFSLMHESGHALYEQGVDSETLGTPLSEPVGMAFHESQSRLWENMVGRDEAFWEWAWPMVQQSFPEQTSDVSLDDVQFAVHDVEPGLIRVEADEVTYNLHVILRFELERDLLHGNLTVDDLPEAWNQKMKEYLGVAPDSDCNGVLQDMHWSRGMFGYFPSYALGNMIAAQVFEQAKNELGNQSENFKNGNFEPLKDWLTDRIYLQGKRYRTEEFVEQLTGDPLRPNSLIQHLKQNYVPYYT